jgi:predicted nucleotide-binding protein
MTLKKDATMAYIKFNRRVKDLKQEGHYFEANQIYFIEEKDRIDKVLSHKYGEIVSNPNEVKEAKSRKEPSVTHKAVERKKVFIVHGRERSMRENVSDYIKELGLEPVVLFEQTNKGRTIIKKFEECAEDCSYAVVLLSPDDKGCLKDSEEFKFRARQNVILELGYMWGKLGRDKVAILYRNNVEKPSDADGIVHIPYYRKSGWREQLKKELEEAIL